MLLWLKVGRLPLIVYAFVSPFHLLSAGEAGIQVQSYEDAAAYQKAGIGGLGPGPVAYPFNTKAGAVQTQSILSLEYGVSFVDFSLLIKPNTHY